MEVWNGIWKNLVWNGIWIARFLVWNGNEMEKNCQYEIWKNRLPSHTMLCLGEEGAPPNYIKITNSLNIY